MDIEEFQEFGVKVTNVEGAVLLDPYWIVGRLYHNDAQ
jgi:hypothetical protein